MDSVLVVYLTTLILLVVLEGLLAADNAVVMAVMVKHLPEDQQKKALLYGLVGAVVLRFSALFLITILAQYWQIQAIGAAYLLYLAGKNIYDQKIKKHDSDEHESKKEKKGSGFWMTVLKVELADIAFAIDSMLAAVAIAITLPEVASFDIGGINAGPFAVMFVGGLIGVILIRFAAQAFVKLLNTYPDLETAAFFIVGWVGVKLVVLVLSHPQIGVLPESFPHSALWTTIFWSVLLLIAFLGYYFGVVKKKKAQ